MSRSAYLRRQKAEKGRKLLGVFPAQYPREILWALDLLPVEIWDPPLEVAAAGSHLQSYVCSVAHLGLELILQGRCDDLDGFLFPHTCDSIQNLSSLVRDAVGVPQPCFFFYHPKAPYRGSSRRYYADSLQRLARQLGEGLGLEPPDPERLRETVAWGGRISAAVASLYRLRAENRLRASAATFYQTLRGGEYLHPEDFAPLLERFLADNTGETPTDTRPAIVLSGVLPNPPELLTLFDDLGLRVGHDDLLSCSRRLLAPPACADDPIAAMVETYFRLPPCSTKNSSLAERGEFLLGLARQSGARGVVFNTVKFCETELFDVPPLVELARSRGLATLVLDTEVNGGLSGQLITRVEAFAEILRGNSR